MRGLVYLLSLVLFTVLRAERAAREAKDDSGSPPRDVLAEAVAA